METLRVLLSLETPCPVVGLSCYLQIWITLRLKYGFNSLPSSDGWFSNLGINQSSRKRFWKHWCLGSTISGCFYRSGMDLWLLESWSAELSGFITYLLSVLNLLVDHISFHTYCLKISHMSTVYRHSPTPPVSLHSLQSSILLYNDIHTHVHKHGHANTHMHVHKHTLAHI